MSEAEFSAYLSLLSRLLKISPAQRAEIQDELRDHLELRLGELVAAGHTREAAVGLALADLGDAAGLAREFHSLAFRKQRRRWLRWTMASLAGTAALVLAVINLFPFQQEERFNPTLVAMAQTSGPGSGLASDETHAPEVQELTRDWQDKYKLIQIQRPVVAVLPETAAHNLIEKILPDEVSWSDVAFQEALHQLEDWAGVEIYIHPDAGGAFTDLNQPVTLNVNRSGQMSCRAVLTMLLRQVSAELSFAIRDNMVVVLPLEDTADLRIYDCRDFLSDASAGPNSAGTAVGYGFGSGGPGSIVVGLGGAGMSDGSDGFGGIRYQFGNVPVMAGGPGSGGMASGAGSMGGAGHVASQTGLVTLLQSAVQPETWSAPGGGSGTIYEYRGLLIIKQLPEVHTEIGNLIDQLRSLIKANGMQGNSMPGNSAVAPIDTTQSVPPALTPQQNPVPSNPLNPASGLGLPGAPGGEGAPLTSPPPLPMNPNDLSAPSGSGFSEPASGALPAGPGAFTPPNPGNPAGSPFDANALDANALDANALDANALDANALDANALGDSLTDPDAPRDNVPSASGNVTPPVDPASVPPAAPPLR